MRPELVDEFPGERRDYIQMAVILFVTALEAFLSGAFAINMAFPPAEGQPPSLIVPIVSGLVWAFMIFNIDRYMVLGMEGLHRRRALVPALIRMALAVLIGVVMSTPLVLQVFQSEIGAKVALINQERASQNADQLKAFDDAITKAQAEVDKRRQDLTNAQGGHSLEDDAAYKAAADAWKQATTDCTLAQSKATREFRGELPPSEGGTGQPGASDVYRTFQNQADAACKFADDKAKDLDAAKNAAQRTPDQIAADVKTAGEALALAQKTLETKTTDRSDASKRFSESAAGNGLLIRLAALDRISREDVFAGLAHLLLIALLASIEILPVLFKIFKQWTPLGADGNLQLTAYECRWRDNDLHALERGRAIERNALAAAQRASQSPVEAAEAHQRYQTAVNDQIAQEIAAIQLEVMRRQLREWARQHQVPYQQTDFTPPPALHPALGRRRQPAAGRWLHAASPDRAPATHGTAGGLLRSHSWSGGLRTRAGRTRPRSGPPVARRRHRRAPAAGAWCRRAHPDRPVRGAGPARSADPRRRRAEHPRAGRRPAHGPRPGRPT